METIVLYPSVGIGHLAPMAELAKLLVLHGYSVAIVILPSPFPDSSSSSSLDSFISRLSSSNPSISFHRLPQFPVPARPPSTHLAIVLYSFLRAANPYLRDLILSLSQTSTVRALILDFFCTDSIDVAADLHLPAYAFFSTSASNLAVFLYLSTLYREITCNFKDLGDTTIHIPGLPPIPASDMPDHMQEHNDGHKAFADGFGRLVESKGILINSFESLESRSVKALSEGLCVPGRAMPPVYCIGPLITASEGGGERHECLDWLDTQPKSSVLFLCFGSMGRLSAEQVKEIAIGLERSEQRFLWVVRRPIDPEKKFTTPVEPDLDTLLPEGFLERTEGRGMVVKAWAPQVEVLQHESVGGFVTHCGWNSVLEAMCAGVPMIGWPLYAEQKLNKVMLVGEMKLAVEMKGINKGLVAAEEVETRVRWLMESEEGKEMRERAAKVKESAAAVLREGGSSHAALAELLSQWKGK